MQKAVVIGYSEITKTKKAPWFAIVISMLEKAFSKGPAIIGPNICHKKGK